MYKQRFHSDKSGKEKWNTKTLLLGRERFQHPVLVWPGESDVKSEEEEEIISMLSVTKPNNLACLNKPQSPIRKIRAICPARSLFEKAVPELDIKMFRRISTFGILHLMIIMKKWRFSNSRLSWDSVLESLSRRIEICLALSAPKIRSQEKYSSHKFVDGSIETMYRERSYASSIA